MCLWRAIYPSENRNEKIGSLFPKPQTGSMEKYTQFRQKLTKAIDPYLPAKDLAACAVRVALEIEYGPAFAGGELSDKMIDTIANTIMTNPELRREMLSMVSPILSEKIGQQKNSALN